MIAKKSALVMGGNGRLGQAIIRQLKMCDWKILSVDYNENGAADANLLLDRDQTIQAQIGTIYEKTENFSDKYDSMMCVAG